MTSKEVPQENLRGAATRMIVKLQDHLQDPAILLHGLYGSFAANLRIRPLFFSTPATELQTLLHRVTDPGYRPPNFHSYFSITTDEAAYNRAVIDVLKSHPAIAEFFEDRAPALPPAVFTTDGLPYCPGYLKAAPQGINSLAAWTYPGGRGSGIRFADVEQGWDLADLPVTTHRDSGINLHVFEKHGAAVLSVLLLPENE